MAQPITRDARAHLETAIALGGLLQRLEHSAEPFDADQYQALVARLKTALAADLPEAGRQAVLAALPAAAELYENMHYAASGLCCAPLEQSVVSEQLATQLIQRVAKRKPMP